MLYILLSRGTRVREATLASFREEEDLQRESRAQLCWWNGKECCHGNFGVAPPMTTPTTTQSKVVTIRAPVVVSLYTFVPTK